MKKFICLMIAIIALLTMVLVGCGDSTSDPATTPGATKKPEPTQNTIIATQAPTQAPTAEPTPSVKYDDIIRKSEHKYYFASSIEAEGSAAALGPEYCFDDDETTRWSSVFYDVEEAWICIQFGYPVIINGVEIYENKTWGEMLDWEAQYYNEEKGEWVTVYQETGSYEGEYYEFAQNTEPTYAFRLNFFSGTGNTITINEIYLQGLMVEVPEGTAPREPMSMDTPVEGIPENVQKLTGDWIYSASSSEMAGDEVVLPPEFAFDGDSTTRWSSAFHDLDDGCWIDIDFKAQTTISGFVFNEVTNWGYVTDYDVQIMENGEWKTVYSGERFDSDGYVSFAEAITTTQLRFLFNEGNTMSGTVSIWEIDFYN